MKAFYYHPADERQIVLLSKSQIETKPLCNTYDNYGQQCGCYAAGCYSINNTDCSCLHDLRTAINEKFGPLPEYGMYDYEDELFFVLEGADGTEELDIIEINGFIKEWIKENTSHVEATVFEYHDGSNWHSLPISFNESDRPELEEVEDELNEKIVSEYEAAEWSDWDRFKRTGISESFTFTTTQFATDFTIAKVDLK